MEKLLGLLHEGTIIDFRAIYTAALRYKFLFALAIALFTGILAYNYYNQPTIYSTTLQLKAETTHKISNDLSALLPTENANPLTVEELSVSFSGYTFLKNLSKNVSASPGFSKMNFGNMKTIKPLWGYQIEKRCSKDKNCIVQQLAELLGGFFAVEQSTVQNRFTVNINSIDKNMTMILAGILSKTIEEERVRLKQVTVQKEIDNVSHLIDESRSILQKLGGYEALQEQEKLQTSIDGIKEQMKMLQLNTNVETANSSALQAKLLETKKRSNASTENKENFEAFMKIKNRLNDIKQNILFLSHIDEKNRSQSDKQILNQLKTERDRLIAGLPAEQRLRAMQIAETIQEKNQENVGNVEFDYTVSKNKQSKLLEDYQAARLKLDQLIEQKIANETKINGMKADLDFLKGLESKLMSLKLINATMNSDLLIEDGNQFVEAFKRASFTKLSLFSFFISGFLYLLALVIKHSLDDKIYNEDDVRLYFKNLDFVGEVPSFD